MAHGSVGGTTEKIPSDTIGNRSRNRLTKSAAPYLNGHYHVQRHHVWSVSEPDDSKSKPSILYLWDYFLLSACLHVHLPSSLTWNFLSEPFIHFTSLNKYATYPTHLIHIGNEYKSWISLLYSVFQPTFDIFILGPNISLSIPFLNTLSMCSSLSGGPYFASIRNKRQNNDSVYF